MSAEHVLSDRDRVALVATWTELVAEVSTWRTVPELPYHALLRLSDQHGLPGVTIDGWLAPQDAKDWPRTLPTYAARFALQVRGVAATRAASTWEALGRSLGLHVLAVGRRYGVAA